MLLSKIQEFLATLVGDIWYSTKIVALWPWPAILRGKEESLITGQDYRLFTTLIQPGDMLVTTQLPYLGSNKSIRGVYKHLMVYTGPVRGTYKPEDKSILKPQSLGIEKTYQGDRFDPSLFVRTITHATSEGIGTYDLLDIYYHYDHICVVRPWKTLAEQQIIVDAALDQVGKSYDFCFDSSNIDELYCTELGAHCLKCANIKPPPQVKQMTKFWKPWRKADIWLADYFVAEYPVVCTTVSCNAAGLYKKSMIGEQIREKLLKAPDASGNNSLPNT